MGSPWGIHCPPLTPLGIYREVLMGVPDHISVIYFFNVLDMRMKIRMVMSDKSKVLGVKGILLLKIILL